MAEPHFPRHGISMMEDMGHIVSGNLLAYNRKTLKQASPDLIIYVPLVDPRNALDGVVFLNHNIIKEIPTVLWILYPDEIVGWNTKKNCFGITIAKPILDLLPHIKTKLVNSRYTKWLMERCKTDHAFEICYPGIDTETIKKAISPTTPKKRKKDSIRVLWHHRWSNDKNFKGAVHIILRLAIKHPEVIFYIGRKSDRTADWYNDKALKNYYNIISKELKALPNVKYAPYFKKQAHYWRFISHFTVSFACSYHETFGLAMLEHGYAGAACVVPDIGAYPEIHKGASIVAISKIENAIEELLVNNELCCKIADTSHKNALTYDLKNTVKNLVSFANLAL